MPHQLGPLGQVRRGRRIHDDIDVVRLQDAVRCALGIVAAALVVEYGDLFRRAFPVPQAYLQDMAPLILLLYKRLDRLQTGDVKAFLIAYHNLMPTAVNGSPRLDADKAISAGDLGVRRDFEPADNSPAVQALMVMAQFLDVIPLLVAEVALQ